MEVLTKILDLFVSGMMVFIFSGTGSFILKRFNLGNYSSLERFLTAFGIGYSIYGVAIFILGILALINPITLHVILLVGVTLSILSFDFYKMANCFTVFKDRSVGDRGLIKVLLPAFLIFFAINTFISFAPLSSMDAILCHYALAREYLEAGKIFDHPGYFFGHIPQLAQMINLFIMGIRSEIAAALLNSYFGMFAALAVYCLGKRFFNTETGILAATLFYCSGLVTWEATGGFIELHLAFFIALHFLFLFSFLESRRKLELCLSGLFLGTAISIKVIASNFIIISSILLLVDALKSKSGIRSFFSNYLIWLAFILVAGSHWYIFNYFTTGNPFYPLFYKILGGTNWNESTNSIILKGSQSYGYGISFLNFLKMPFDISLRGAAFDHGELIGPLILVFSPLSLFYEKVCKRTCAIVFIIISYLALWFFTSPQTRFLLPVLTLSTLLAASGYQKLCGYAPKYLKNLARSTIILFVLFSFGVLGFFGSKFVNVVLGKESKEAFLSNMVISYDHLKWINENLRKTDRVAFFSRNPVFYCDIPYIVGDWGHNGIINYDKMKNPKDLYEKVKSLGITHIATSKNDPLFHRKGLWEAFTAKYTDKIYDASKIRNAKRSSDFEVVEDRMGVYRLK
jgi:4-amino-4-deoxy-L-arabinose transferase-like glycosyltransferase